jgi:uncharacterized protein YuzE
VPISGHYDREADIAWIVLPGYDGAHVVAQEEAWGLREVDERTGEVVALEFWKASHQLPPALLQALPIPSAPQPVSGVTRLRLR